MTRKSQKGAPLVASAEGYDLYAKRYENDTFLLDSFERDVIFELLGAVHSKNVLDVGCGTGRLMRYLAQSGAKLAGVDVSAEMLKICEKNFPRAELKVGNFEVLPFEDEQFDLVVASFVIVHLDELEKAFDEAYRVLKPGGHFIVTNINQRKAPKLDLGDGGAIVIRSFYHRPEDVFKALENSFFEVEREEFVREGGVWINQLLKAKKGE